MSLSRERTRAYLAGALTGAFTVVALLARREGRSSVAILAALASLACGATAVGYEEAAASQQGRGPDTGPDPTDKHGSN